MESDEGLYHAKPQRQGRIAHEAVDTKSVSSRRNVIMAMPVYSTKYGLMGKIDVYYKDEKKLVERKYQLKQIFQGHIYQLWAQFFCLREMGYEVEKLAFYESSTNKSTVVPLPTDDDEYKFCQFINEFRSYNPLDEMVLNPKKCTHCIYCNMCDKTIYDNVY